MTLKACGPAEIANLTPADGLDPTLGLYHRFVAVGRNRATAAKGLVLRKQRTRLPLENGVALIQFETTSLPAPARRRSGAAPGQWLVVAGATRVLPRHDRHARRQ